MTGYFSDFQPSKDSALPASSSDAPRRRSLQLKGDDERWDIDPKHYGWFPFTAKFSGFCWYCAEPVGEGSRALYSKTLRLLAHFECKGRGL